MNTPHHLSRARPRVIFSSRSTCSPPRASRSHSTGVRAGKSPQYPPQYPHEKPHTYLVIPPPKCHPDCFPRNPLHTPSISHRFFYSSAPPSPQPLAGGQPLLAAALILVSDVLATSATQVKKESAMVVVVGGGVSCLGVLFYCLFFRLISVTPDSYPPLPPPPLTQHGFIGPVALHALDTFQRKEPPHHSTPTPPPCNPLPFPATLYPTPAPAPHPKASSSPSSALGSGLQSCRGTDSAKLCSSSAVSSARRQGRW